MLTDPTARVFQALDDFRIEIPSWGFAHTGTRFGKFLQPAAATCIEEKFADAGEIHRLTGCTPTLALHVLWDLPNGLADVKNVQRLARENGVAPAPNPGQTLLGEYKPFEPAFYHTDIADWGMALELARSAGPQAKVLVDTGHHYQGTNIEQIVAWLLRLGELGGFHFNDRKYADDDLTLGSIDPYQVFRIFHEILSVAEEEREG